jgi:Zn-dependent protease
VSLLLLLAALVVAHEVGHAVAAWALNLRPRPVLRLAHHVLPYPAIRITPRGLDPSADLLIALAGPFANLLLAFPLLAVGSREAAFASAMLGLEQLLPIRIFGVPLDGWTVRHAMRRLRSRP